MSQQKIDIHTHIFNLKYLPIQGVLEAHKVPTVIAKGIEFVLLSLTSSSNLNAYNKAYLHLEDEDLAFSKNLDDLTQEEISEDIAARIDETVFLSPKVMEALEALEEDQTFKSSNEISFTKQLDSIKDDKKGLNDFILKKIKKLLTAYESVRNHLKWFRFMMRSEETIFKNLQQDYSEIEIKVFHMMDPEYFFSGKPTFSIEEKIQNMLYFIENSEDKLIGFVPYNPLRENHLTIVSDAIDSGFKGIKFYPPMGYRPAENSKNYEPLIPNVKNADLMDLRIKELFKYAIETDTPVFTHCTPDGFEAVPGSSGKNADPRFWKALLEQDEFSKLRLCLGHAGGVEGWFAKTDKGFINSYAKGVYDLCVNYEHVYCEVGFLADIKDDRLIPYFRKRLQELFKNDTGPFKFREKIMYGSDWHILFNHGIQKEYDKAFEDLFKAECLKESSSQFFASNAKRYLKI